jgi:hypothetical protein
LTDRAVRDRHLVAVAASGEMRAEHTDRAAVTLSDGFQAPGE